MTGEGAGVSEGKPHYYMDYDNYKFGAATEVNALVYDKDFYFTEKSKSVNFKSVSDAIADTAPDQTPLVAYLKGGSGDYYVQWTIAEGTVNPSTGKFEEQSVPATFPEEHLIGVPEDANGLREFTHSITAADNLANNKMYKYVITASNEARTATDTCTIYVSTYADYAYRTIGANDVATAITNATGYIYTSLATLDAGLLRQSDLGETSIAMAALLDKAATSTDESGNPTPKNITKPVQLEIYNINNKPANLPAYLFDLNIQLEIDKSIPSLASLAEGDTVPVYRYNPISGNVEEIEGVVAIAYDEAGDIIRDDSGNPELCVQIAIMGGSAALGSFALGYDSAGTYTFSTAATGHGQIYPNGTKTYTLETRPQFATYPMNGYVLDSVSVKVGNRNYTPIPITDTNFISGNVFTFDPGTFGVRDGSTVVITANFKEADPQQPEYGVTVSLSGDGSGDLTFISGAALLGVGPDGIDTTDPALTETTVGMNTTEGPVTMPSSAGVFLNFNPGAGYKVDSMKINGVEYQVTGTSYYVSALVEDLNIEVVYAEGMADPTTTSSVTASIEDEPEGQDAAFILDPNNAANGVKSYTYTVPAGAELTITSRPETDWVLQTVLTYIEGIADPIDLIADVNRGTTLDTLNLLNVVTPTRVEFRYKHVDTTLTLSVDGQGGTINPAGTVDLTQGERLRVRVTPASASYVIGSLRMDGTDITSMLTSRDGGTFSTFTVIKADAPGENDGVWINDYGTREIDQVIYVNDKTATIIATFDPVATPAPSYVTVRTSVAGIGGGTVTPSQMMAKGENATVYFFPDRGYKIKSVTLDGKDMTSTLKNDGSTLEINNVQNDRDVVVTFTNGDSILSERTKYTINPTSSSGGFISPGEETLVYDGGSQRFSFFPMTGYVVSKLYVNGTEVTPATDPNYVDNSYTFVNVKEDKQIHVTFAKEGSSKDRNSAYTVIVKSGEHGTVSPVGVLTIAGGASLPVTIMPDTGYTYDKVNVKTLGSSGSGINKVADVYRNTFTFYDVQEDLEIEVTFRELGPGEDMIIPTPIPDNLIVWTHENSDIDEGAALQPPTDGLTFYKQFGREYAATAGYFTVVVTPGHTLDSIKVNGATGSYTQTGEGVYSLIIPQRDMTKSTLIEVRTSEKTPSVSSVNTKTITVTAEGNGNVSPAGNGMGKQGVFQIETGKSQTFYFFPDAGNMLSAVYVNNSLVNVENLQYTLASVTANTHIRAVFESGNQVPSVNQLGGSFDVRVEIAGDNTKGIVSPGVMKVIKGGSATFTFLPVAGYETHLFDGSTEITNRMSGNTFTSANVTANKTYTVRFEKSDNGMQKYHNVKVIHGDHGWASPEGITRVAHGSSLTITAIPDSGYTLDQLTVNGNAVSANGGNLTYTLNNITEETTVNVTFKTGSAPSVNRFDIMAYSSAGGMVSPTSVKAASGTSESFTCIPLQGYKLVSVSVDGGAAIPAASLPNGVYTLTNITADHTIYAEFEVDESMKADSTHYTVFVQAGTGGSISPSRAISVPAGGSQTFTIIPEAGYKVKSLTIISFSNDAAPTNPDSPDNTGDPNRMETHVENFNGSSYTLFNITSNKTFRVDFQKLNDGETATLVNTFDITATASVNGSISPSGTTKVAAGAMSFYSFIPTAGYKLSYAVVDGNNVPAAMITNNQYAFTNVLENHTIHAVFCPEKDNVADFATVVVDRPQGGTITPTGDNGSVLVRKGDNATFKIAAVYGYQLASIKVNGNAIAPNRVDTAAYSFDGANFTFKKLSADATLSATFTEMNDVDNPTPKYTTITVSGCGGGAGGTTSYGNGTSVIEEVPAGSTLDVSFIPDQGKAIKELIIIYPDGSKEVITAPRTTDIWQKGYITFTPDQVNGGDGLSIDVTWRNITAEEQEDIEDGKITPATYHEIVASSTGTGYINPQGRLKIANGASLRFTMTPNAGSELSSVKVDGNDVISQMRGGRTYTFSASDRNDHVIEAAFGILDESIDYFTIGASAVGGGNVSPESVEVAAGQSSTINFFPDDGYRLTSISVDGADRVSYNATSYTFPNVSENHSIKAYFNELEPGETSWQLNPLDIDATAYGTGSVSPEHVQVPLGSAQQFTLKPGIGFEIDYIMFNGVISYVPAGTTSYTVAPIDRGGQPNTFEVYYKMVESNRGDVTVAVSVDASGTGSGSGSGSVTPPSRTVPYGGNATFYILPDPGSTIDYVRVDGQPIAYSGVDGDESRYLYGWESGPVSYRGGAQTTTALYRGGANTSLAAENDTFYSMYRTTIPNVTKDVTLEVGFRKITEQRFEYIDANKHQLIVTSEGGGTVSPVGSMLMPEGETEYIHFKTFSGYYLDSVTVEYFTLDHLNNRTVIDTRDVTDHVNGQSLPITMGEYNMEVHAVYKLIGSPSVVNVSIGDSKIPVYDEDGNIAVDDDGNWIYKDVHITMIDPDIIDPNTGDVVDFPRNKATTFFFETDEKGPNGRDLVLDKVFYNGEEVPVTPGANYITLVLGASGKFDITWRELDEGEDPILPPGFDVTAVVVDGTGGKIDPPGTTHVIEGHSISYALSVGEDGWLISSVVDISNPGQLDQMERLVPPEEYRTGVFTLDNVICNHEIQVTFIEAQRVYVEWNNDEGYVTPNTAPGEFIYVAKDTSLNFVVAPYFGYEVEGVWVDSDTVTGDLRQTAEARDQILGAHSDNRVIYFEEGNGVAGFNGGGTGTGSDSSSSDASSSDASSSDSSSAGEEGGQTFSLFSLFAAPSTDDVVASANQNRIGVEASQKSFARAYEFQTPLLNKGSRSLSEDVATLDTDPNDFTIRVLATFKKDPNQKPEENQHHITVSVADGIGGTVSPTDAYVEDGGSLLLTFTPDPTYHVAYLIINGNAMKYTGNSYLLQDVHGPMDIQVVFDTTDSRNPVGRTLRTLQALAQTGDLNAPAITLLLLIAALSLFFVVLGSRRRKKKEEQARNGGPRGPMPPGGPAGGMPIRRHVTYGMR